MKPLLIVGVTFFGGCTSVEVKPLDSTAEVKHICIQNNPKVIVSDFLTVVRDAFDRHSISTEVIFGNALPHCEYLLTYTAFRSAGIAPKLKHAELRIERAGRQIAYAEFDTSIYAWGTIFDSTKTKMDPIIDELLSGLK